MEELEFFGWWWLPSNQDNRIAGTLEFSNRDGARLSLTGFLDPTDSFEKQFDRLSTGLPQRHPIILGVTKTGELVTLQECLEIDGQNQEFVASVIFIGAHFKGIDEIRFHKTDVQFSHLSDWVVTTGFEKTWEPNEHGRNSFTLSYNFPDEITAIIKGGSITITRTFSYEAKRPHKRVVQERPEARFRLIDELHYRDWLVDYIYPVQTLLSLGTDVPNDVVSVTAYSKSKTKVDGEITEAPIQVVHSRARLHEMERESWVTPNEMLFSFQDIVDDFATIAKHWLRTMDELGTVCDLFFGVQKNLFGVHQYSDMYLQQHFLTIMQALELYHRLRINNQVLPRAEHRKRKIEILKAVPQKHQGWLKGQLAYSNEPTLKERVTDLANIADEVVSPLVTDKEELVKTVVQTRHFYTHFGLHAQRRAARGFELLRLIRILYFVLQMCLLLELGLAPERCATLIKHSGQYRTILKWKPPTR